MICSKCKKIVALNSFSESNCIICGDLMTTPHIPSYKVCEECSLGLNVCQQCGEEFSNE